MTLVPGYAVPGGYKGSSAFETSGMAQRRFSSLVTVLKIPNDLNCQEDQHFDHDLNVDLSICP
jgi:hypothetical protein